MCRAWQAFLVSLGRLPYVIDFQAMFGIVEAWAEQTNGARNRTREPIWRHENSHGRAR